MKAIKGIVKTAYLYSRYSLELSALVFLLVLRRMLPASAHRPLAWLAANLWYYIVPFRKSTVLENLQHAFPEKSAAWRRQIAKQCANHFARVALEFTGTKKHIHKLCQDAIEVQEGRQHLKKISSNPKGLVTLTGHFGNWELLVTYFGVTGDLGDLHVLAKPLHNPIIEKIINHNRKHAGFRVISTGKGKNQTGRPVMRVLRKGGVIGLLADQDAGRRGIFVPFFDLPASTFKGAAYLAIAGRAPLSVITCAWDKRRKIYTLKVSPPIEPDPEATDREEEIRRITALHTAYLEEAIREHPEQYFWFHRRWKTRPKKKKKKKVTDTAIAAVV